MNRINLLLALALLLTTAVMAPAIAQQETEAPSGTSSSAAVSGSVVSYTESTLVMRTDTGDQMIFVLGATMPRPATLTANDRIRVEYQLDPAGTMLANSITLQTAEGSTSSSSTQYDSPSGSAQHEQHETGAMGSTPTSSSSSASSLPATASPLPIIGLIGLIGVGAGILLRRRKKAA